jgi:AcrR family transcriptional regulator
VTVRAPATARSRRTRGDLARAAHDDIARRGSLDASAIADAAGVSTATFYAHFATHDDAIAAALDISLAAVVGVAERCFRIEALIETGLSAVVERLVSETHAVFRTESLVMRTALARLSFHQGTRDVYRHHEGRSLEHLTRQIALGQKAHLLRSGPADQRAISLLVLMQGLHNTLLVKKRIEPVIAGDLHRAIHALLSPE